MRTLHVIKHIAREGPARIGNVARDMGLDVAIHDLPGGATVPAQLPDGDLLVVMGGPMGVGDIGDPRFDFLDREIDLLRRCLADDRPVLGICLGAQLMAHALGARIHPAPEREVGWGPVAFVAHDDPVLAGMRTTEVVLHWHSDTFDLPPGATLLASSEACPNQMFRVGRRAFGLQFHIEVDAEDIAIWVCEDTDFVRAALGPGGPAKILAETLRLDAGFRRIGDRLIRNLIDAMI
jgi:GMP synthase (glutamine-hydrolysing)